MGNIREQPFDEIWNSAEAAGIRQSVATCPHNCWMIGSAAEPIKRNAMAAMRWALARRRRIGRASA
jgi:hypothetical protein